MFRRERGAQELPVGGVERFIAAECIGEMDRVEDRGNSPESRASAAVYSTSRPSRFLMIWRCVGNPQTLPTVLSIGEIIGSDTV